MQVFPSHNAPPPPPPQSDILSPPNGSLPLFAGRRDSREEGGGEDGVPQSRPAFPQSRLAFPESRLAFPESHPAFLQSLLSFPTFPPLSFPTSLIGNPSCCPAFRSGMSLLPGPPASRKRKDTGFPLKTCGNDGGETGGNPSSCPVSLSVPSPSSGLAADLKRKDIGFPIKDVGNDGGDVGNDRGGGGNGWPGRGLSWDRNGRRAGRWVAAFLTFAAALFWGLLPASALAQNRSISLTVDGTLTVLEEGGGPVKLTVTARNFAHSTYLYVRPTGGAPSPPTLPSISRPPRPAPGTPR